MLKFMCSKKGFSLIEVLIVVVVLGILTAVGVPAYNSVMASSNKKVCSLQMRELQSEAKNWCIHNNFNGDYNYKIASVDKSPVIQSYTLPLDEGSLYSLLHDIHNGGVSCCPAGGTYYIIVHPKQSGIPEIEIFCDCEAHNPDGKVPETTAQQQ